MRSWMLFGLTLLCIFVFSASIRAQGFGRIVGTVTDPSGAVVVNASVTATQQGKGFSRTTNTNGEGYYVLDSLRPAQYDVTVELNGFRTFLQKGATLLADQTLTVNVSIQDFSGRRYLFSKRRAPGPDQLSTGRRQ